jgi:hypothetical protein
MERREEVGRVGMRNERRKKSLAQQGFDLVRK